MLTRKIQCQLRARSTRRRGARPTLPPPAMTNPMNPIAWLARRLGEHGHDQRQGDHRETAPPRPWTHAPPIRNSGESAKPQASEAEVNTSGQSRTGDGDRTVPTAGKKQKPPRSACRRFGHPGQMSPRTRDPRGSTATHVHDVPSGTIMRLPRHSTSSASHRLPLDSHSHCVHLATLATPRWWASTMAGGPCPAVVISCGGVTGYRIPPTRKSASAAGTGSPDRLTVRHSRPLHQTPSDSPLSRVAPGETARTELPGASVTDLIIALRKPRYNE